MRKICELVSDEIHQVANLIAVFFRLICGIAMGLIALWVNFGRHLKCLYPSRFSSRLFIVRLLADKRGRGNYSIHILGLTHVWDKYFC